MFVYLVFRLSGLPIVIPINANGCQFDNNGNLINCGTPPPPPPTNTNNCEDLQFSTADGEIQVTLV